MDSKKKKYILLSCGVLLIVVIICVVLIAITGVGVSLFWPLGRSSSSATETPESVVALPDDQAETEVVVEEPTTPADVTDVPEEGESVFPAELLESAATIEQQVQQVRGLTPSEDFDRELITEADLQGKVKNEFFVDYTDEEAQQDVIALSTLGLLPPGFDLKQWYTDLYGEQIAGFYDDDVKTMYVVQGEGFGGSEKTTYAHEYTHVLQDQVYGFDDVLDMSEEACTEDSEKCAAIQALIEGDAVTSELLWFQNFGTKKDYADLMEVYENYESPVLDSAPPYMEADLYFPYDMGQVFVETFYNEGGYERVDEVYANLPVTTEQIMHPERYPDDTPIPVDLPDMLDVLGEGWTLYDENVMGEWYTFLILNKAHDVRWQLSEPDASAAAEGWGGDAYAIYLNEDTGEVVFLLDYVWDSMAEAEEFTGAFETYADRRWDRTDSMLMGHMTWTGVDGVVDFFNNGSRTVWVIAPDAEIIDAMMFELE